QDGGLSPFILLDTSAVIDGRIADISRTGFIRGRLLVPTFVLEELQHIADSSDDLRRNRGRRGLDVLRRLRDEGFVTVEEAVPMDLPASLDVDAKLVQVAKRIRAPILTNDYNLNRVAEIQGVSVLNVNELANAVKSVVLPGEEMATRILQEGREPGQGVGFLDDGTMVVVEAGAKHAGKVVDLVVTRVHQTAAGRMIFARLRDGTGR
ncbi:MAG TPA: PIN domain-containing protein, partial [Dehalococcoidia bacterium]|nr:PIN domain-containing protein [Dehalococcoidia bacterium]